MFTNQTEDYEKNIMFHPLFEVDVESWFNRPRILPNVSGNHHIEVFLTPFAHAAIYWYPFEEWCTQHHPNMETVQCLTTLLLFKDPLNNIPESSSSGDASLDDPDLVAFFKVLYKIA